MSFILVDIFLKRADFNIFICLFCFFTKKLGLIGILSVLKIIEPLLTS
jgi:hypothetical protein